MAKTGDVNMEVSLDRQSREAIRSLVAAIDGLAKSINNGEKVDNALISEPVVKRLVEDVTGKQSTHASLGQHDRDILDGAGQDLEKGYYG